MNLRRKNYQAAPVTYTAVGATRGDDLLRFPPANTTPFTDELFLGSGSDRFIAAADDLMTWGAQTGAGIDVVAIVEGEGDRFGGLDPENGDRPGGLLATEEHYSSNGESYLKAGTSARLEWHGQREPREVRVIYTLDEERRIGFAWGTADDAGAIGEELFFIEHRKDDSVWAVVRGFLLAPEEGFLGVR